MTVDLDQLADRAVAAAPTTVPPIAAVQRRVRRRRRRRMAAALVPLLVVVVGVSARAVGNGGRDGDLTVAAGDGSAALAGGLGPFVWPAPPRDLATVEELIDGFTTEVLSWPADEIEVEWEPARGADTELFGPQMITLVNTRLDREVELMALELPPGWGAHHVGASSGGSIHRTDGDSFELDPGSPPPDTERIDLELRLVDGTVRVAQLEPGEALDLGDIGPDDIVSQLHRYLDGDGHVIGASGGQGLGATPDPTIPSAEAPTPTTAVERATIPASPGEPSQDADAARRDGIVAAVAALPGVTRVQPIPEWFGATTIEAPEGTWVISAMDPELVDGADGCTLGDTSGEWGRDFVSLCAYAEILLLDDDGAIVRAYPFGEVTPQQLALGEDALYCARRGDGGAPDSMLCRIDRTTHDATVRIFPHRSTADQTTDRFRLPADPAIDPPRDLPHWGELSTDGDGLTLSGSSGSAVVDPDTLELSVIGETG
ncbi:MAG: hypothetical protein S0880_28845 [Actinomycetota bacterium]|nr:hypothetical protein [Actinomycetota bacterium]